MVKRRPPFSMLLPVVILLLTGCGFFSKAGPPEAIVSERSKLPEKVAILPFINRTSDPEAGKIVRKMFYNFFSSLNYEDVELAAVDAGLSDGDLLEPIVSGEEIPFARIGEALGVDAVIVAEVTHFGKTYAVLYAEVEAGIKVRMINCQTGQTIWASEHTVHVGKGDVPLSIPDLAKALITSVVSYQTAKGIKAASELCMEVVATIPNPPEKIAPLPKIKVLVHNGAGKLLTPGEVLRVVMIGDANHKGFWDLPPLFRNLPLEEREPGVYVGSYQVAPDDRLPYGRLVGRLQSSAGTASRWEDVLGPVSLGRTTSLPLDIAGELILTPGESPYLVEQMVLVRPQAKLIIKPGTVIWFQGLGMVVRGEIQAQGTLADPVRFLGLSEDPWKGIFLDQGSGENIFSFCEISRAEFGLRIMNDKTMVDHGLIGSNIWGIVVDGGNLEITRSIIRDSKKTGVAVRDGRLLMSESIIAENHGGGILLKNSSGKIENNNIVNNNEWELKILDNLQQVELSNNWWGSSNPEQIKVVGTVMPQNIRQEPLTFFEFQSF